MKKIAYILYILMGIILTFPSCKNPESLYEEYLVSGGLTYPGRPVDAAVHPGKNRIDISWKNGSDPKVVKANISWNNNTESVDVDIPPGADIITHRIEPLEENIYSFMIRTYDNDGNVSVPVEVMGTVYGSMYENSLVNRSLKGAIYDPDKRSITIEWGVGDPAMSLKLDYTDIHDHSQTMLSEDPKENFTTIPDFKAGTPLFYTTLYKPDSLAIDIFMAPTVRVSYQANMALKSAQYPFTRGSVITETGDNRFYKLQDDYWIVNEAAAINGNVDSDYSDRLEIWSWVGYAPVGSFENGKVYRTVELEAGTYRFDAIIYFTHANPFTGYVTAALGSDLPDVADISGALASAVIPSGIATGTDRLISVEFVISEKSAVSLGFVASLPGSAQLVISEVALWGQF